MECHGESQVFFAPAYVCMSSVRVEPNVIDYIVCPSSSRTYYYRPVCAITITNEKHFKSA